LPFGKINTIQTIEVKAGWYVGADKYMMKEKDASGQSIYQGGRETFAAISIIFESGFSGQSVKGEIRVGKNVGKQEEKFVEVTGVNGCKIRIDLTTYFVDWIDNHGNITPDAHLFANPIHLLVREVIAGRPLKSLFEPDRGREIVATLEEWC